MLSFAAVCGVCGMHGSEGVCSRCGSVLSADAACPMCGRTYEGPFARCEPCETFPEPDAEALPPGVWDLGQLPGVGKGAVIRASAGGFQDAAGFFALALPKHAIDVGVHRAMTRQLSLSNLKATRGIRKSFPCSTCGYQREGWRGICPVCGDRDKGVDGDDVERRMADVKGEVYDLLEDPDFNRLPGSFREELLDAFAGAGIETKIDNEYEEQFQEWQAKGLDTSELERVLREEGSGEFRARFVGLLRAQLDRRTRRQEVVRVVSCPVCDATMKASSNSCGSCGARFR